MKFLRSFPAPFFATCAAVGACSSGGSSSGSLQTSQSYCDAREARARTCAADGAPVVSFDRSRCTREFECIGTTFANPAAYFSCRTSSACASSEDACVAAAAAGRSVAPADTCAKKYAECKASGATGFKDDVCGVINALNDAASTRIGACFAKPCDQVKDCLDATIIAISPSCND